MNTYSDSINHLIEELAALPSIGAKSAQRLAFHILNMPQERVENLAGAITAAKKNVRYCKKCFTLTDQEICPICSDPKRDQKTIMVVEDTRDLAAYEKRDSIMDYTMCCRARSIRALALRRQTSG